MQFTTVALSALSVASVTAQMVKVHVVRVGAMNGSLAYYPNNLVAAKGDMVQFQFAPANHTVTQSTFDNPCAPIALHSNITGLSSGYMPVSASAMMTPTYTILVNDTKPMWLYCAQGKHCQNGMTMVINENTKANASRSLTAYQAAAKEVAKTIAPAGSLLTNGTAGSTTTPSDGSSTSPDGSSTSGTSPDGSTSSGTTTGGQTKQTGNSASSIAVPAMAGMVGMAMALFI